MGRIAKNFIYNVLYQLFTLIVPLITVPYLARILGAKNLGIYGYVRSLTVIITTIGLVGVYDYGNRQIAYLRDDKIKLSRAFFEIMILRFILGVIASIIFFLLIYKSSFSIYFYMFYPWLLANCVDCSWVFVAIEKMGPAVLKNFIAKFITLILIFVLIKVETDFWKYLLIISLSTLITNFLVYYQLKDIIVRVKVYKKNIYKHVLGSLKLFLPQIATLIYLQVDKVMIQNITGMIAQVGYYDQAQKIVQIPMAVITVLSTVMMPRIANEYSNNNNNKINEYWILRGKISLLLSVPMTLGIALIASDFIPWYLGDDFSSVIYVLMILSPLIIINSLSGISGKQYFTATNQIAILNKAYFTAAAINILLNFALIRKFGYVGAGISTIISSLISVIIQYYYLCKQMKMKSLVKEGLKYFLFSTFMGIIVFIISIRAIPKISTTFSQIIVGSILYFSILLISKDDLIMDLSKKFKRLIINIK